MENLTVLICDDNIAVHESLGAYLNVENMNIVSVYDGKSALQQLQEQKIDLVILDIMMPEMFGTDVCKEIRKTRDIPILMLSAKSEEFDRILGLELGADDYVTKPFSPREVTARVKNMLKRIKSKIEIQSKVLQIAELLIDIEAYTVYVHGEKIDLTPKEIETLYCLASNQRKVLSREQILNKVWGYDYFGDTRAVDTQIKRLRKKLPHENVKFSIVAVYGVGYKFEVM